jgi:hypothetical protein
MQLTNEVKDFVPPTTLGGIRNDELGSERSERILVVHHGSKLTGVHSQAARLGTLIIIGSTHCCLIVN